MVIPFPLQDFSSQQWTKNPCLTEGLLSQTLLRSKARCPGQSVSGNLLHGWLRSQEDDADDDGTPIFRLAKDKYVPPN